MCMKNKDVATVGSVLLIKKSPLLPYGYSQSGLTLFVAVLKSKLLKATAAYREEPDTHAPIHQTNGLMGRCHNLIHLHRSTEPMARWVDATI
jgi:hypothetical protein